MFRLLRKPEDYGVRGWFFSFLQTHLESSFYEELIPTGLDPIRGLSNKEYTLRQRPDPWSCPNDLEKINKVWFHPMGRAIGYSVFFIRFIY